MAISSSVCKHIYQADGENRSWEFEFEVLSAQDIAIYVTAADGTESKVTTGYDVSLLLKKVTYPTVASGLAPLAAGCKITLLRTTPLTQEMTLQQQGTLDAKALEQAYDKLTLQIQELAEQASRSIKYLVSSGKTHADAQTFLDELQSRQNTAMASALSSVEETKQNVLQSLQTESSTRSQADITLQQSIQTLAGTVSSNDSAQTLALSAEESARSAADTALQNALTAEQNARVAADNALAEQISQLHFIEFVASLPLSGSSQYIYAVPQEETDLDDHPIVVLYVWQSEWKAVGAFSTNLDPDSLLTKTEAQSTYLSQSSAQSTYLPLSQKAAANGVASLGANGKVLPAQLPYATASTVGGVKMSFDETTATLNIITEE